SQQAPRNEVAVPTVHLVEAPAGDHEGFRPARVVVGEAQKAVCLAYGQLAYPLGGSGMRDLSEIEVPLLCPCLVQVPCDGILDRNIEKRFGFGREFTRRGRALPLGRVK